MEKLSFRNVRNGIVATENPLCSDIGVDILKKKGSSVDAVIAAALCIGVTNSYSSGLGGGGFMVIRDASGASTFIDFREEAPSRAHAHMYDKDPLRAQFGGLAVGVPGEVRGFEEAHKRYGKLPWKRLFEPSIKLSRDGWAVEETLEQRVAYARNLVLNNTAFREVFAPNGNLVRKGDVVKRPNLAKSLEAIGKEGPDVFYEGWIAENLVATTKANGGILAMEDMKRYRAKVEPALIGRYRGRKVITTPLPTSGPVLLSILNIMEGFPLPSEGRNALNWHRLMEAYKFAYAQRTFYGDPVDPVYRNISEIARKFMRKQMADEDRARLDDDITHPIEYYHPQFAGREDHGTAHISVLGPDGMAVSLTTTVNLLFGAQVMDRATGIILNDEMDDFSIPNVTNAFGLPPSPYNYIHPHKRPLSSCIPTIVEKDGEVELIVGASGGSRIITSVAQAMFDVLDYDMDVWQAVGDKRAHHQLFPNLVALEDGFREEWAEGLEKRNHTIWRLPKNFPSSGVEAIQRLPDGTLKGASDFRKGGQAAGF
ncbi:hypothetical protein HK097_010622 [Rhizophlyctis rosea]|uniref:Gamma-glutamyltransferase n=1 Tax=Rhizophlyctis rosea TaxID=64517 RepID=A0AAD5S7B9_9FUNG|nr:hypothetical protein HK097_010622 [Rhizophlyctis rosea]